MDVAAANIQLDLDGDLLTAGNSTDGKVLAIRQMGGLKWQALLLGKLE